MTHAERLAGVRFDGIQHGLEARHALALATDPLTLTTFVLLAGETVEQALARVDARFREDAA